jgi:hypothetical protein
MALIIDDTVTGWARTSKNIERRKINGRITRSGEKGIGET